jgi:hypothetical protein
MKDYDLRHVFPGRGHSGLLKPTERVSNNPRRRRTRQDQAVNPSTPPKGRTLATNYHAGALPAPEVSRSYDEMRAACL